MIDRIEPPSSPTPLLGNFRPTLDRGRSAFVEAIWIIVSTLLIASMIPGSAHRRWILKRFGARIGKGVVIKPGVRVTFPWRLVVGDHAWIGDSVWIDNLVAVEIGTNACVSQGAYICTGNHDWSSPTFDLIAKPIIVGEGAWVAARAVIGPGVILGRNSVVALGAVATADVPDNMIVESGSNVTCRRRLIRSSV